MAKLTKMRETGTHENYVTKFSSHFMRFIAEMKAALVWDESFQSRLLVLCGDLEKLHFGLSDKYAYLLNFLLICSVWQSLIEEIFEVYHNGAIVNMTLPYKKLKSANVLGTIEVFFLTYLS